MSETELCLLIRLFIKRYIVLNRLSTNQGNMQDMTKKNNKNNSQININNNKSFKYLIFLLLQMFKCFKKDQGFYVSLFIELSQKKMHIQKNLQTSYLADRYIFAHIYCKFLSHKNTKYLYNLIKFLYFFHKYIYFLYISIIKQLYQH